MPCRGQQRLEHARQGAALPGCDGPQWAGLAYVPVAIQVTGQDYEAACAWLLGEREIAGLGGTADRQPPRRAQSVRVAVLSVLQALNQYG